MTRSNDRKPLRLWPGVAIVALQLAGVYVPNLLDLDNVAMFYGAMGALFLGPLLLFLWWLAFSRARWTDRLLGLVLLTGAHAIAMTLADPTAKLSAMIPGVPWLCAAFVASLFVRKRAVTVAVVLVFSLGWTLVRTGGVDGRMGTDYSWRWSETAEQRFLDSAASDAPSEGTEAAGLEPVEVVAWPGFRGPRRDNVLAGVTIDPDWRSSPPRELWRRPVGPGWSSFALVGRHLCTQEQRDEDEVVVCYEAASGDPIWVHSDRARFWEVMAGAGPRATPTYHDGRLYTLGATGLLNCLDLTTGSLHWSRDIAKDSGASVPDWGFSSSPLVVDDLVVVHAAGAPDGRAVVAYDLATGAPRWFGDAGGLSYASPHLATISGVRQIVMITSAGAFGLVPESGEPLWHHAWPLEGGARVIQPAILPDSEDVLIGTSFGLGTRRIDVSSDGPEAWTTSEKWTSFGLKPYYNDLVVHHGTIYGFDGHILAAVDVETGERAWKGGRYGNGQMLLLPDQDLLLVLSERGELALVRASPERFEEVARMQVLEGKTWNHPILADGVLYVRNGEEAAAYRVSTTAVAASR